MSAQYKSRSNSGPGISDFQKYLETFPSFASQIQENLKTYGTPFLSGSYGCRKRHDLPNELQKLLYEELPDQLVEISIRPEGADGHHWTIEYHVLAAGENGKLVRAIELGRKR